ncbi:MAG: nitrate reductase [Planctomycetaceae bacterium]|nr:nitrate reductase [Planctomycetaceae bacterium]
MITDLLHARTGPLTQELLREPGNFGLGQIPTTLKPNATTGMVCGFCATGCNLTVHMRDGEAINLSPTTDYPVNLGMACPKGWEALTVLDAPDRAITPLLKNSRGQFEPVDWNRAMLEFVTRFKSIQAEHGPHSVAFISTGQMVSEEMAFLGALAKFGMGILHGDGNTRQCMATAVVAYKQAFGFDAPPYTYADFEESDVIVLVGSNLCLAHPIMWERVMRNPNSPEIIVVDPRMTETAMNATQHLAIAPKSDQTLLYGIARILIERGWVDQNYVAAHTSGFEEFAAYVQDYSLERVSAESGLSVEQIERFAETIHLGKRVSFWWTMGVNQSHQGVRTAQAIINLALMTGNIGRPGTGANSITGQCNAMGSRLFSNTTNLLGGHDFAKPEHRQKVAGILGIDEAVIPSENSWAYNEIMEGVLKGKIKGLWIICTNTAHSWINQNDAREILDRLDFLVVQDMYHSTETAQMADLVLPAAGWAEKEGTFINSERRIGVVKKVRKAPGQALSDFNIFRLIAHHWGCGEMFAKWSSPAAVFDMLKECSRGMPCDITGIEGHAHVDRAGGIQWPFTEVQRTQAEQNTDEMKERRLFEDGPFYHSDGRAKFLFEDPRPLTEKPSSKYPFILLTGRGSASQWHTQTRTSKSAVLRKLYPEQPFVELSPVDAKSLGVVQNDQVLVSSQRGKMVATAFLTHNVQPGQIFIPMHYEATNRLTDAVFDPYSKQPSYKSCAVAVAPIGAVPARK